ncbi:hypothetical protein F8G81_13270 [Arthrobacter sp. CDRTa11]|uniref:hypothetical protein n=1 Tax=Arthrobacter sp. CDRTa11 TaxID=2651199 RepID=UPI002265EB78|nr:hypothetical protein [Arthrobacter sp. CDRTa11]UZX03477.1 hypothetical protein F8G81_13270 [Arthrobacter sp. CDRTa11]
MTPGTIFGLALVGAGIFLFAISPALTERVARIRVEWFQPNLDRPAFKRRNVRILRIMAGAWVGIGVAIAILGLVSAR